MPRTHHAVSYFRLSCNCIQGYSSVQQTGEVHKAAVLCSNCGKSSFILHRYPAGSCGAMCRASKPEGGVVRVRCSEKEGHPGRHFDCTVAVEYDMPPGIRSGKQGNT